MPGRDIIISCGHLVPFKFIIYSIWCSCHGVGGERVARIIVNGWAIEAMKGRGGDGQSTFPPFKQTLAGGTKRVDST